MLTGLGILLGFIFWFWKPTTSIPLSSFVPLVFIGSVLAITLGNAAYQNFIGSKHVLPRVLTAQIFPEGDSLLCLLEPSSLFSHDTLVSLYYLGESEFERLIGFGVVLNIQENGMIQIMVTSEIKSCPDIFDKLRNNDSDALKKLRVKPSVTKAYLHMAEEAYRE